jgi:hypothetical protein
MCGRQNHNALAVDISKINGSLKRVHTKIGNKVTVSTSHLVKNGIRAKAKQYYSEISYMLLYTF